MEFASANFLPVWKVAGGTRTLWFARFQAVREMGIRKMHRQQKEAEALREQHQRKR